jgi:glycosyltransferase involved in cell wall biosynthesis
MHVPSQQLKKTCLITDSYWPSVGGVERWVHSIASFLSRHDEVIVITHSPQAPLSPFSLKFIFGSAFDAYRDEAGNRVVPLTASPLGRLLLPALLLWNLPLVRRIFPKRLFDFLYAFYKCAFIRNLAALVADADIVHCFSTGYLGVCATEACARKALPLIHSPAAHFSRWGDSPLLLQSYAKANAIMCLSESFKTEFLRRMPEAKLPIAVIPAPVFSSKDQKRPDFEVREPFILFLGRREKHKGLFLLLSALKKLKQKACLVVAGPGDPVPAEAAGVVDAAMVDEPTKHWLLDHCAVFCLPSSDESFGIVYIEAMMHAKPIVALDIAPVNELVINKETGILVPPGRDDLLAQALDSLLGDAEKRRIMGENGYKRYCELYEGEKVMKKILLLYNELLERNCLSGSPCGGTVEGGGAMRCAIAKKDSNDAT